MFPRVFFASWLSLVAASILSEMHTQWAPTAQKCASQNHWLNDCKDPYHWEKYNAECRIHTSAHYPSFWSQWLEAVVNNVRWCGVDKCESLFTFKGIIVSCIVISAMRAGPVIVTKGWRRLNNE